MRLLISALIVAVAQLALCAEARAQTPAPSCPSVTVESKVANPPWAKYATSGGGCWGAPVAFTARVTGVGPEEKYTLRWTVSDGKISDGQGTSSITVSTAEADVSPLTATVELVGLRGLKPGCDRTAQASVSFADCDPPCTALSLLHPPALNPGEPLTVMVDVSGAEPGMELKYNWEVSAGQITAGKGTPSITIDTTGLGEEKITVRVEVEGLLPECDRVESGTIQVMPACVLQPRLFDRFGDLSESEERARLDSFASALQTEPQAKGYVIVSGGGGSAGTRTRLDRMKNYLAVVRGIDPARIETVDGGGAPELTVDLYVRPPGSLPPERVPNF